MCWLPADPSPELALHLRRFGVMLADPGQLQLQQGSVWLLRPQITRLHRSELDWHRNDENSSCCRSICKKVREGFRGWVELDLDGSQLLQFGHPHEAGISLLHQDASPEEHQGMCGWILCASLQSMAGQALTHRGNKTSDPRVECCPLS